MDKVVTSIRLDGRLLKQVQDETWRRRTSVSAIVRTMLETLLQNPEGEWSRTVWERVKKDGKND